MVRVSPAQVSTASAEISPQLWGRPDFVRYQNGVELQRGFVSTPEGTAVRLPGTRYVGRTKADAEARIMPFIFNEDDTLILEWTNLLLRFWRAEALVQASGGGDFELATPYPLADVTKLQFVPSADRVYLVDGVRQPQRLNRFALDNWTIEDTPFEKGPFKAQNTDESLHIKASGVTGTVTLTADFDIFQAGHVGAFFHLTEADQDDVPYWAAQAGGSVGQRYRNDGKVYEIVVAGGDGFAGVNPPFHERGKWKSGFNDAVYLFIHDGAGIVQITAVTDPRTATATVVSDAGGLELPATVTQGSGTYRWRAPLWSGVDGWPAAIAGYQARHWYGGAPASPRTLVASATGAIRQFKPSTLADGSFNFDLPSGLRRLSRIKWIEPGGRLIYAGTGSEEIAARSTGEGQGLTIESTRFDPDSARGSSGVHPVNIDGRPVFVGPDGRQLYGLRYVFEDDRNVADPLTIAARHILAPGVKWMAWQSTPWRILWLGLTDGSLVSFTYYPDEQVFGFGKHALGGDGAAEWGAVKPKDDGTEEELWLVVRRTIGGQTVRHLEIMERPFGIDSGADDPPALEDAWHLMAAVRYQGAATGTITGLDHVEGETVSAWTELGGFTGLVVTGGAVTLPNGKEVTSAIVGLDPSGSQKLRYLDLQAGAQDGGSGGRLKVMRGVGARLLWTAGGDARTIQPDERGVERESPPVRLTPRPRLPVEEPPILFSGVADIDPKYGWSHTLKVELTPEGGAPMTVQGLTPTFQATDN